MLHLLLIAIFASIPLRDSMPAPLLAGALAPRESALIVSGLMLAAVLAAHAATLFAARRLDRTRRLAAVGLSDGAIAASRFVVACAHMTGVLALGWLDAVRALTGNLVFVDEALAIAPALLAIAAGTWSGYPIHRRLREALIVRSLDEGLPVHALPRRGAYVWGWARHNMGVVVVPLLLMTGWWEAATWAETAFTRHAPGSDVETAAWAGIRLIGTLAVLVASPVLLRRLWSTTRLEEGPLRDDLLAMCRRHRVRVREILVWRTHGMMINAMVMGLAAPARYILLTDGLLESLPADQVRAVAAHEIGHVRHRHMPWLIGVVAGSILAVGAAVELVARLAQPSPVAGQAWVLATTAGGLAAAVLAFGAASRRFEWQADAFAARSVSDPAEPSIDPLAAHLVASTLAAVAALNGLDPRRRSWRHGSIGERQQRVLRLAGAPAETLAADRAAGWIKAIAAGTILVSVAGLAALAAT